MSRQKRRTGYFSRGNRVFWFLILLWVGIQFLHLLDPLFDGEAVVDKFRELEQQERLEGQLDSLRRAARDSTEKAKQETPCERARYAWEWKDPYTGRSERLSFTLCRAEAAAAGDVRKSMNVGSLREGYLRLSESDSEALADMVGRFRTVIQARGMGYEKALYFVVGAIQAIPYTLVLSSGGHMRCPCILGRTYYVADCRVRADARGCCNDVDPLGVYSPLEFALRRTGDCDTRTLFAYGVLGALGYDVTILNSDAEMHSILGVHSPRALGNGAYVRGRNGKKYYIWELTAAVPPGLYTYKSSVDSWESVIK